MRKSIQSLIGVLALTTTIAFANTDDKKADTKITLPAATPALETPAPQSTTKVNEYNKHTPAQKAAIVELKLAK